MVRNHLRQQHDAATQLQVQIAGQTVVFIFTEIMFIMIDGIGLIYSDSACPLAKTYPRTNSDTVARFNG